jgi:hypothetical protein
LTKIAVADGMSGGQIRNLYERARTKGAADFRVYLKYQMSRPDNRGKTIISRKFSDELLSFLSRYQKQDLTILLKYAVMLYEYTKQVQQQQQPQQQRQPQKTYYSQPYPYSESISGGSSKSSPLTDNIKKRIEEAVKAKTSTFGFAGVNIETVEEYGRPVMTINVNLNRFYSDPKVLSMHIKTALKTEICEIANTPFKVWIKRDFNIRR